MDYGKVRPLRAWPR